MNFGKRDTTDLNELALADPMPGDYWQEMFCPYFMVVRVQGDKITVLSALGGQKGSKREHEVNARVEVDGGWTFDPSKAMVVDRQWMTETVKYGTIDGFVADVVRNDKSRAWAAEWQEYERNRLTEELASLSL